jgi:hypothetical protein
MRLDELPLNYQHHDKAQTQPATDTSRAGAGSSNTAGNRCAVAELDDDNDVLWRNKPMKLRFKLGMWLLALGLIFCGTSALALTTALTEQTTITLGMFWVLLSAFVAVGCVVARGIWKISRYVKGVEDKLKGMQESSDRAHGAARSANEAAMATNKVAVGADLEAQLARKEMNATLRKLPCQISKQPKKCTKRKVKP